MNPEVYKKMYAIVCGAASVAVDLLAIPGAVHYAESILRQALSEAEEEYLSSEES